MTVKLKKYLAIAIAAGMTLSACSNSEQDSSAPAASSAASVVESTVAATADSITVEDNYGDVTVALPVERVVATDNRTFAVLDAWGITPVAVPKRLVPKTLPEMKNNDDIVDLGNHREPDLEAIVAVQPDLIVNGQRFSQYYEDIKKLNPDTPIIELEPREGERFDEELRRQVLTLGEVFGKDAEAKKLVSDFDAAIERAKKAYNGTDKVMAVNVSGGEIGYVAPHVGRVWGPVYDILGLRPALEVENASSNHEGDDVSVEAIAEANPDWIFVLDRDGAINSDKPEYVPAFDVIKDNAVIAGIAAVQGGKLVQAPDDTYVNESIITYTKIFNEIADAFEAQSK